MRPAAESLVYDGKLRNNTDLNAIAVIGFGSSMPGKQEPDGNLGEWEPEWAPSESQRLREPELAGRATYSFHKVSRGKQ